MTKHYRANDQPKQAAPAGHAAQWSARFLLVDRGRRNRWGQAKSTIRPAIWYLNLLMVASLTALLLGLHDVCAQPSLRQLFEDVATASETNGPTLPSNPDEKEMGPPEALPPPRLQGRLPLAGSNAGEVQLSQSKNGNITLVVRDASLSRVLALLAQTQHLNIVAANDIDALISITLRDVPVEEALTAILSVANYTWVKRNDIILVTSLTDAMNLPADVQGRQIQVFELDFASARSTAEAITGFLSPIGKVSVIASDSANNRLTRELIVVEDLPQSLARIAAYIYQVDQPPRQVLIEAHIFQVNLDETTRCGVNLDQLLRISGSNLNLSTTGFANPSAPEAFLATLKGGDLSGVIEALQKMTDAKTLGSPKLLVLNGQEAEFQVGEKLGYRNTTTTETSTMESVQFLNVGVVLNVTPRITADGRVLMHIAPKVSTGDVSNGLPNEKTTELHTDVILNDGQGMIIGGLIKEKDATMQTKVPYLGDVKGIGWLFRKTEVTKERVEIIIALVPRIQPYDCQWAAFEQGELVRAGVPLFHGPLHRNYRPWDPIMPDGKRVYRPLIPPKKRRTTGGYYREMASQYVVPPHPLPEQRFCDESCDEPQWYELPDEVWPEETLSPAAKNNTSVRRGIVISDQTSNRR